MKIVNISELQSQLFATKTAYKQHNMCPSSNKSLETETRGF